MNFQRLLAQLDAVPNDCAETFAAGIVNAVSEWAAENGHPSLVRDWAPAAQPIEVKRYLAECIDATAEPERERTTLSPPEVAQQLGVTPETVIGWIKSGALKATNVGKGKARPRYRIQRTNIDLFLQSRQPEPRRSFKRDRA